MELMPSEKDMIIRALQEKIHRHQRTIRKLNREGGEVLRAIPWYEDEIKAYYRLIEKLGGEV